MTVKGNIFVNPRSGLVKWKIKDYFSASPRVNECWVSPSFHVWNGSWHLQVCPNRRLSCESPGLMAVFLWREDDMDILDELLFTMGVIASDGTNLQCRTYVSFFESPDIGCGCSKLYEVKELYNMKSKYFIDGVMTIYCDGRVIDLTKEGDSDLQTEDIRENRFSRLSRNFKDLFMSGAGADVTIKVKHKEFRVQSHILLVRSPVFAAMLRHDMKEKNTGVVEILEYDFEAFRQFLMFLYSGEVEKLTWENVVDLYSAAEKYDVEDLKAHCSEFMMENMSVDSFCKFLSLAIIHDDTKLKYDADEFFFTNEEEIMVTSEWASFKKQYPEQSTELLIKAGQRYPDYTSWK